jgi:hypothetical protein
MEFLPLIVLSGLQVGCIYAMMALSYYVIINATGILNFAQGEWMMLSAIFGVPSSVPIGQPRILAHRGDVVVSFDPDHGPGVTAFDVGEPTVPAVTEACSRGE